MSGPTIQGEKTEWKNGLFVINCPTENNEKMFAFWNSTKDIQFNVAYEFQEPQVTALGDTINEGNKYAVTLYPQETKPFIRGLYKAMKRSISFGTPDKEWMEKQAKLVNESVDKEITVVKQALKKNPKADGKYTAEYIAKVCMKCGVPFVDLTFAPRQQAVSREFEAKTTIYSWKRPSTYLPETKKPCLYAGKIEPNDIDQGNLGDCYFMCALAGVSEFPDLIRDIYCVAPVPNFGVYSVRLCKNGWWQTCTVDDLLPINPSGKLPIFAKNREEPEELWVSIVEKAYAKLHGSFMAIKSGDPAMAMSDLTGGPYERLTARPEWDDKPQLFEFLKTCDEQDFLMTLSTPGVDTTQSSTSDSVTVDLAKKYEAVGLCTGHAFSLLRVKEAQGHQLAMIRNPWGNGVEWNGDWSDNSSLWTPAIKKEVDFFEGDDGTFWMSWDDVWKWFEGGSVTYVLPNWHQVRIAGNFEKGAPDVVPVMTVTKKPVRLWLGAHQRDSRGLPPGDKDSKYLGIMITVLQHGNSASDNGIKVASSGQGKFLLARDIWTEVTLEPSDKPYYILVQAYQDADKSFTTSIFIEDVANANVRFVTNTESSGLVKCNPPTKFTPSMVPVKAATLHQVLVPNKAKMPVELTGDGIHWATAATKSEALMKEMAANAAAASKGGAPTTVHQDPAAGGGAARKALKLSVTVVSGHGLVAKDMNGKSDPFVTIIREDGAGKKHPKAAEHSTKYIKNTLDPVWGDNFTIEVQESDVLNFECWDKDVFGKDEMGNVRVKVATLGLETGGSAKMEKLDLGGISDATGHIQVLFSAV